VDLAGEKKRSERQVVDAAGPGLNYYAEGYPHSTPVNLLTEEHCGKKASPCYAKKSARFIDALQRLGSSAPCRFDQR